MSLTIGVDVGGTKVAAGVVDEHGHIVEKLKRFTPAASPGGTIAVIADVVNELLGRYEVDAVGIGAAGFVDQTRSTVLFAPNLAWRDEPVKKLVEERIGRPVVVENDANAAAWAEAKLGAARGLEQVLLITVGTGIGAGIVLDGQAVPGPLRLGRRARPLPGRAGRPAVRLRQPGAAGSSTPAAAPWWPRRATSPDDRRGGGAAAAARRRQPGRNRRPGRHHGGARGRRRRALRCFEIVGSWLGRGLADLSRHPRPWLLRDRRRRVRSGRAAARSRPGRPTTTASPVALTGEFADVRLAELGPDAGPDRRRRPGAELTDQHGDAGRLPTAACRGIARPELDSPVRYRTAPSSSSSRPERSPSLTTRVTKPAMKAATAMNAASAEMVQCRNRLATSR